MRCALLSVLALVFGLQGLEVLCNDRIGDHRHHERVERSTQDSVLLASMTDADDMVHITQSELHQLVRQDAGSVRKTEQGVIGEGSPKAHGSCVEDGFMAKIAEASMAMHNFNLLPDNDISEEREEGKDRRKGRLPVNDKEWDVVDLESIGQVSDSFPAFVGMRDNYDLVASVDQLGRELVDVTFDPPRLGEEEVADHGNIVRHRVFLHQLMTAAVADSSKTFD